MGMGLVIYLIGLIALCVGIFLIRKSNEEQNAVIYLIFTAVFFMIIQSVEAGIIILIPFISINAFTFGCLHILESAVLWYLIFCRKKRQKYFFHLIDVTALLTLIVFVIIAAVRQFGTGLNDFNFELSDSARHYMYARNVADHGRLVSAYFAALNSGLIMNALHGIIRSFSFYRIFILFETGILFLNGAMFWVLIRRQLKDRVSSVIGIVLAVAYMMGYPWNTMVFGTAYLSTGILCVAAILFLMEIYFYNVFCSNKGVAVLLAVSCYALLRSYSLFVPPVLACIVLLAAFKYVKANGIPLRKVLKIGGGLLSFCVLIGIAFLYFWLVRGVLDKSLDALSWWGYIYGTPYADFLFAVPFCIFWFIKSVKTKTFNTEGMILLVFLSYVFVFLLGNYFGKVSAYYYYKNYYILWLAVFLVMSRAIISMKKEEAFLHSYALAGGLLFLVYIGSAEKKLPQDYNLDLTAPSQGQAAADYFGLYDFNIVYGHRDTISKPMKDLYMKAAKLSEESGGFIPYIGEYAESEWTYFALAGAEHQNVLDGKNYEAAVEELQKYPYILSVECEEPMRNVSKFLNTLPVEYENEAGKIYKVDISQTKEEDLKGGTDIDIILRYGFPKLERMGWVEQDEYVNSLQVIKKIDKLGIDKEEFLYPELESESIENTIQRLKERRHSDKTVITFTGDTSEALQQAINDNPGVMIDIRSKRINLNDTIVLRDNTAINGNGVRIEGEGIECGFIGEEISGVYINGVNLEGEIDYGIYLKDCSNISISKCRINEMLQKAICIIGNTKKLDISDNEMRYNKAGGLYLAGNVSDGLIDSNRITNNDGVSKWMSGIVLTHTGSDKRYDLREGFDKEYNSVQKDDIDTLINCPHDIIVKNNEITNNGSSGIYSSDAYKCYVIDNTISKNGCGGMILDYGTIGFCLEGNFVDGGGAADSSGIEMDNTAYNILKNNIITNSYFGIKMSRACVRNLIMENVVNAGENNSFHQYAIEVGAEAKDDSTENIDIAPGYENIICRNSISGNYHSGIFIDKGCYVNDVFDNIIMGAQVFSIEAVSDMFNSIVNNTANTNAVNEYDEN